MDSFTGSEDLFHVAMPDLHVPEPCSLTLEGVDFASGSCHLLSLFGAALGVSLPKEIKRKVT